MQVKHYQHGDCETVDFVEEVLEKLDCTKKEAWAVGNALKYACRAGYKDDWHKDAAKCADFLTRYKSGEFIND